MIKTDWLPSALGPGPEDVEMKKRRMISTAYRSFEHAPGFEVQISGEFEDVVGALVEWYRSGDDEEDRGFLATVLANAVVICGVCALPESGVNHDRC